MVPLQLYAHVWHIARGPTKALNGPPDLASQLSLSRKEVKTLGGDFQGAADEKA